MPQIKQFTRTKLPTQLVNVQAGASSFGGNTAGLQAQARSSEQLSQSLGQLSEAVQAVQLKRDKSDYLAKLSQFQLENISVAEELSDADFEDGTDFAATYAADIEERFSQLDIPNSMQAIAQQNLAEMKLGFARTGAVEQARRAGVKAKADMEAIISSQTAIVKLDRSKLEDAQKAIAFSINNAPGAREDKDAAIALEFRKLDLAVKAARDKRANAEKFNDPDAFLDRIAAGGLDGEYTAEEISKHKTEAQQYKETLVKQAVMDRSLNFLKNNAGVAKLVEKGALDFNGIAEVVQATDISQEMGEAKLKELRAGKIKTDPVVYGNLLAEAKDLLAKKSIEGEDDILRSTRQVLAADQLEAALKLQQKIADAQSVNLNAANGNSITKMIQIGIANSVATEGVGITGALSINHYQDALSSFESSGLSGQPLMDALRDYAVRSERTGVDDLNDMMIENAPNIFTKVLPGGSTREISEKMVSQQIELLAKANRTLVLESIARKNNPSLNIFQGDLPNAIIQNGAIQKLLPGGDTAKSADAKVELPFDIQVGKDGNTYKVFKDGTYELDK